MMNQNKSSKSNSKSQNRIPIKEKPGYYTVNSLTEKGKINLVYDPTNIIKDFPETCGQWKDVFVGFDQDFYEEEDLEFDGSSEFSINPVTKKKVPAIGTPEYYSLLKLKENESNNKISELLFQMLSTYSTDYAESFKENRRYMGYAPSSDDEYDDEPLAGKGSEFREQLDAEFQKAIRHQAEMNISMGNRPSIDEIRIDDIVQENQQVKDFLQKKNKPIATKQTNTVYKSPSNKKSEINSEKTSKSDGKSHPNSKENLNVNENKHDLQKMQEIDNILSTIMKEENTTTDNTETKENTVSTPKIQEVKIFVEDDDTRLRNFIEIMGLNVDNSNKTSEK